MKIFGLLLSWFGYAKVPREAVDLIVYIRHQLRDHDHPEVQKALKALEDLFRSGARLYSIKRGAS